MEKYAQRGAKIMGGGTFSRARSLEYLFPLAILYLRPCSGAYIRFFFIYIFRNILLWKNFKRPPFRPSHFQPTKKSEKEDSHTVDIKTFKISDTNVYYRFTIISSINLHKI